MRREMEAFRPAAPSSPFPPDPHAETPGAALGCGADLWLHPLRWPIAWTGACTLTLLMLASLCLIPPPAPQAPTAALAAILTPPPAALTPPPPPQAEAISPRRDAARHTPAVPPSVPLREAPSAALPADPPRPQTTTPPLKPDTAGVAVDARLDTAPANATRPAEAAQPARASAEEMLAQRCPTQVAPVFPRAAQDDDIMEGRVLTRLQLDASGAVASVEVLSAEPAGYFEAEVRRAALKWRCQPTGRADTLRVPFHFRLK